MNRISSGFEMESFEKSPLQALQKTMKTIPAAVKPSFDDSSNRSDDETDESRPGDTKSENDTENDMDSIETEMNEDTEENAEAGNDEIVSDVVEIVHEDENEEESMKTVLAGLHKLLVSFLPFCFISSWVWKNFNCWSYFIIIFFQDVK